MESGWIIWVALFVVAWTMVGLVVAYMFGGWARRSEASEGVLPAKVRYLRHNKRTSGMHRQPTDTKPRHAAGGRHRH